MLDVNIKEMSFALDVVAEASELVQRVQSEMVSSSFTKDDRSPVTVADFASQALVAARLAAAFPDDSLVGEEDASALRTPAERDRLEKITRFVADYYPQAAPEKVAAWIDRGNAAPTGRFWTLDPIDGTKGFLRGEQYAVTLALIIDGQVRIGVLGCPNLLDGYLPDIGGPGSLLGTQQGQGTWIKPLSGSAAFERLHVSPQSIPQQAKLLRSYESGHTNTAQIDEFVQHIGIEVDPVRMDSQAKYALLAAGKGDLLLRLLSPSKSDYREKIWDQAAGSLIVQEAGGRITDLDGKALDFSTGRTLTANRGVIASNSLLHEIALTGLSNIQA